MTFFRRLWYFLARQRRQAELEEEMRLHVELREARHRRDGLTPDDARRAARVHFGNTLKLREEGRDAWGYVLVERVVRDVGYAVRQLARRPVWTATVVLTLALGVGANTSIFMLVDSLLFRPAPGARPDRLVSIASVTPSGKVQNVSYPHYLDYRSHATTIAAMMAFDHTRLSIGGPHPERVVGLLTSGSYFDVLGIHAALGRTFVPADDQPNAPPVAILTDAFWRSHFDGNPALVNQTVAVNGQPVTIIGIAPPGFAGTEVGEPVAVWLPIAAQPLAIPRGGYFLTDARTEWLRVMGRLADGATVAQAQAEISVVAAGLTATAPREDKRSALVVPAVGALVPSDRGRVAPVLGLVSMAPLLVLLVACANVANLVMTQNVGRQREFAMRRAIGASRRQVIGGLVAESVVLALLAAAVGYAISYGLTAIVVRVGQVPDEVTDAMHSSARVIVVTAALALATTIVFGLLPALTATRFDLVSALKDLGGAVTSGRARGRLRAGFVITQVALSLALIVAAALFVQSLTKMLSIDPGFDARHAVTMTFDPGLQRYEPARRQQFVSELVEKASAIPGVTSVGVTAALPLGGTWMRTDASALGGVNKDRVEDDAVTPGFFDAMGVRLIAGRTFTTVEAAGQSPVVIVNETLARRLWPHQNPIGQLLEENSRTRQVVGVVHDGKFSSLTDGFSAAFYVPYAQLLTGNAASSMPISLVARTNGDERTLLPALLEVSRQIDPDLPAFRAETLGDLMREPTSARTSVAALLGVFGMLTLAIAAIGLYGVAAHSAATRRREVGLRMALGAQPSDVRRLFVGQSLTLAGIGVAIGCAISLAASRLLTSFLFGLTPTDFMTFAGGAVLLTLVALVASYLPARAAARVNPVVALRQD